MKKKLKRSVFAGIGLLGLAVGLYFLLYKSDPYFKKMEKLKVKTFTKDAIAITADVVCHNPNSVEVRLASTDFQVKANGKHVSDIHQTLGTTIPAESDFRLPLSVTFSPRKIFKLKDLLGVAFTSLKKKSIKMDYEGVVKVGVMGTEMAIPVEYSESIALR